MRRTFFSLTLAVALAAGTSYEQEIEQWREARAARLRSDSGWLTVTGLFWLKPGVNRFGSDPANDIVLPASASPRAGVFELRREKVTAAMDGRVRELRPDSADAVEIGPLHLSVIRRGGRYGVRLRDRDSAARKEFRGLKYFPVNAEYRVTAKFVAEPRKLPVANVLGQTEPMECPGYAVFRIGGQEVRLYPVLETPDAKELFFIFRDRTAGKETYGAGRFLYSTMPKDGTVVLDFNKAYNPPCAFTPYATCPLPPKENRLLAPIPAGEMNYGAH